MMRTHIQDYNIRLSAAITWLRFPLIFMIIMLHCYSVVRLDGARTFYFEAIYPFSLWLGETGVPCFFFISGYLFFLSRKSYKQKLKARFHTLFLPYILWNSILLAFYMIAYTVGHPQAINHNSIADYTFMNYLRLYWDRGSYDDGNFVPLLCPFWYIRNLLIMSILSPLVYYTIKYGRELFLLIVAIWWMNTHHNAFILQTLLFFCLGAYFSIMNVNPLKVINKNKKTILTLFTVFAIADIVMHTIYSTQLNLQTHRISLILNIPVLLLLADFCVSKGYSRSILNNSSFIVFAVHYPIVVILRKYCAAQFSEASDTTHIILYFICIIISTIVSLLFYCILETLSPKLKNILSGNR